MVMAWQWPFLGGQQYLWDIEWRNVYYKFIKILFINENTWNSTVMPWVTILHSSSTLLLLKLTFLKRVAGLIRWRLALKIHDHLARSVGSQANHLLHFLIVVLNKYETTNLFNYYTGAINVCDYFLYAKLRRQRLWMIHQCRRVGRKLSVWSPTKCIQEITLGPTTISRSHYKEAISIR